MSEEIKNILNKYPDFKANIGIEIHVQLKTNSKIFCFCPNKFGEKPNKNICPICAGYPGVLPSLNKKVVDFAIMAGLATNCKISKISKFARKHYMYPDLPKNYQITQNEPPICKDGYITIEFLDGTKKNINLKRIHIEEDAGKNIHGTNGESFVDLNRAGTPLLEIVSQPDISTSHEARLYLTRLKTIVQYLGISNANMEQGSFRGDINISVRHNDEKQLGTKVELKNINSFKFIVQAIEYEIERQIKTVKTKEKIYQETRTWDSKKHKSIVMRTKENATDYRYLEEPDLPLIVIDQKWVETIKKEIPELPEQKIERFKKDYKLSSYEAKIITSEVALANYFEEVIKNCKLPQKACNWLLRNVLGYLKENKITLNEFKVTPQYFAELISIVEDGLINTKIAQDVFIQMAKGGKSAKQIIKEQGLEQINNTQELEKIIKKIINDNPKLVENYKAGKERLFGFFVGQSMKATKGKGNPKTIHKLIKKYLNN